MSDRLKAWLRRLPALLGVALLIVAIYAVQKEFRHLRLEDIAHALHAIPVRAVATAVGCTVLSYAILTLYDRLGTIYAGHKVSYARVAFASFCAYALSHNIGLAAVSGAAVRFRLYSHWGLTTVEIAKVIAFCSLTFGLGGLVLGGYILWVEPASVPFFGSRLPFWVMHAIGSAMWLIVLSYVTLSRRYETLRVGGHVIGLPGTPMALGQVLLATVDVALTALIFYVLLPPAHGLTYGRMLGVYLASYSAGLATNLPGGIGVFDGAMLLGLEPWVDAPHVLGAIVVFRLCYYVIPLFVAGSLFAGNEILLRGGGVLGRIRFWRSAPAGVPAPATNWSDPDLAVAAATGAVALSGAMLLAVGVIAPVQDFSWLDRDFAIVAMQAGEYIPSLIGAGLLVLAVGLSQRVNLAFGATMALLLCGAAFTVAQGQPIWVPGMLIASALVMAPFRSCFYRHAHLLSGPLQASTAVPLFALTACVLALTAFERHIRFLSNNSWWKIVLSRQVPNSLRATVLLAVLIAAAATWGLIRPGRVRFLGWDAHARNKMAGFGAEPVGDADGLLLGEAERAGVAFRRMGRFLLALGDPAGSPNDRVSAIWRLRDLADQEGRAAAVFRAGPGLLKVYADLGMSAVPLGIDGLPLGARGGMARGFLVCMAERDLAALVPILPRLCDDGEHARAAAQ